MTAILTGVRGNLNAALIYISLMAKDIDFFHGFVGHLHFL
jgi:hypothetical protein